MFRGNEHEASGQLLKGTLAICVPSPIKVEDIHLRLTGVQRLSWTDPKITPTGLTASKVDRTNIILQHQWEPFWGTPGKSTILEKGNYEFPFELMLPGDTCESFEGLQEASITYKLKATIARGKLAYDLHAYKHVRIVRTLESSALEFLHAMSVENIWPNKVEYSIVVPQKAIVFGSYIQLESRFTPLLKGLEIGDISIRLMEIHDFVSIPPSSASGYNIYIREFKHERCVANWTLNVNREEHWHEMIEDTGQEGWVLNKGLELPRKLGKCVQDVNVHGIKVRHKLKMVVALRNPDGHVSELRATLPLTIFISPNIPLDEQGNLTTPAGHGSTPGEISNIAPPGYGEHVLDQLYDEVDVYNLQTPAPMSAVHSPVYGMSRAGSSENLAAMNISMPVPPAALSSRLQDMSSSEAHLRHSRTTGSSADLNSSFAGMHMSHTYSHRYSPPVDGTRSETLSRRNSGESRQSDEHSEHATHSEHNEHCDPEHLDYPDMSELCKVPSYATAMKNVRVGPVSVRGEYSASQLPDYRTAASRPIMSTTSSTSSLSASAMYTAAAVSVPSSVANEPLSNIAEVPHEAAAAEGEDVTSATASISSRSVSNSVSNGSNDVSHNVSHTSSHSNSHQSSSRSSGEGDEVSHSPERLSHRHRAVTYENSRQSPPGSRRRQVARSISFLHSRQAPQNGDSDERSWLHLLQARGRVAT